MNNEELKKKIENIVAMAMLEADELPFVETAEYVADALIAAGIEYVKSLEISDASKEQSSINYYCEMREWKDKCREAEHRAARAEKALLTACAKMVKDEKDDVNIELLVGVIYRKYLKQAEKELAEEMKDG